MLPIWALNKMSNTFLRENIIRSENIVEKIRCRSYESAVRISLIPYHVRRSWGKSPPHFEKLRVAKLIPLLALNLRKKLFT